MKSFITSGPGLTFERFERFHHSANYILFPLGLFSPLWFILKLSSAFVYARGRKQVC